MENFGYPLALSRDWVGILDRRRQILWVNPAWSTGLGLPEEQIVGRIFDDLVHSSETILPPFDQIEDLSNPIEFNLAMRDTRGDAVSLHWRVLFQDDRFYLNGHLLATPKPSDPYLMTFERAPLGMAHTDMNGRWLRVNQRFCDLLGYSQAELLKLTFRDLTLPEDFPTYSEIALRLVTGETAHEEHDCIHICKNGSQVWMHMTGTLIRDKHGAPDYFMLTLESSQARHEMEAALRESQMRYRMVADYTYDWEFWQGADGTYEYVSPSVERMTGYTPADYIADPTLLEKIIVPDDLPAWQAHLSDTESPERVVQFRLQHKSGGVRWIEHICVLIFENGQYLGRRATNRDITDRIERQAELDNQRQLLEGIFRAAPDYIYLTDLDLQRQVLSNRPKIGTLEPADPLISLQQALAIMHPDDAATWLEHYTRKDSPPDDSIYAYEFRIQDGVGGWRWIRSREVVFRRHADGSVHQILGIAHDITPEKVQEQALRESETRFRHMFERHQAIKLLIDPTTGHIVDANPAAAKFYGWDIPTLRKMLIQDINTLPEEEVRAEMQRAASEQRDFFSFKHRLADGSIRDVEVHSAPVEVGGKTLLYSIVMDTTQLHQTRRELHESQNRFDAFMKNSPMAAYIKDLEGRLIYVNPVCAQIFGLDNVEWHNRNDLVLWGETAAPRDTDKRTLEMGMTTIAENIVKIGSEDRVWLTYTFPIQDVEGRLFVGGMGVDITDLKRAEQQLIEMALERERMQILSHFIEKAAHEFRTPLSVIELGLYAMRRLDDSEKHLSRVTKMEEQVFHIVKLVESMVTMTHLDNMAHLEVTPINIQSLMRTIKEKFDHAFPERTAKFDLSIPAERITVAGDAVLLERAIFELLTNAHRFTPPEGRIALAVDQQEGSVVITVRDTGRGVSAEQQRHIFEHFFRVDAAHTTRGFGLGLTIVKRILELHGGDIQVESTPGVGSTFRVVLPAE
ncbi:MAG: hypothetical protein BroJett018_27060 [Chloroflexota bacterium]|nr:MAG: hypothetical protein BroJett018_27060 [Chloroflexota bacterium]